MELVIDGDIFFSTCSPITHWVIQDRIALQERDSPAAVREFRNKNKIIGTSPEEIMAMI